MTESIYDLFLFRLLAKLLLLLGDWFDYIDKFATYYPHYKEKLVINPTWIFVCTINSVHFLYYLGNLLTGFLFTHDGKAYAIIPDIVINKGEILKTSLYLLSHLFQPPLFFFRLTSLEICMVIFKYPLISKCLAMLICMMMNKWQFSLILVSFFF